MKCKYCNAELINLSYSYIDLRCLHCGWTSVDGEEKKGHSSGVYLSRKRRKYILHRN